MRNPQRIDDILELLRYAWKRNPDLRFFQLMDYLCPGEVDKFFLEDSDLLQRIKEKCFIVE